MLVKMLVNIILYATDYDFSYGFRSLVRVGAVRCEMVRSGAAERHSQWCGAVRISRTRGARCGKSDRTAPHPISEVPTYR